MLTLGLRFLDGILRGSLIRGSLSKHRYDNKRAVDLIDGRVRVTGVAHVGGPLLGILQDFILIGRVSLGIVRNERFQIWHGIGKAWEVVKLAGEKRLSEVTDIINEELLCPLDVLGELPDDVTERPVRQPHTSHRTCRWFGQPDLLGNLHLFPLGVSGRGDRV